MICERTCTVWCIIAYLNLHLTINAYTLYFRIIRDLFAYSKQQEGTSVSTVYNLTTECVTIQYSQ